MKVIRLPKGISNYKELVEEGYYDEVYVEKIL